MSAFDWRRRDETTTLDTKCANCGHPRRLNHFQSDGECFTGPGLFAPVVEAKDKIALNLVTPEWALRDGPWSQAELDAGCARCGVRFGSHWGMMCGDGGGNFAITEEAARAFEATYIVGVDYGKEHASAVVVRHDPSGTCTVVGEAKSCDGCGTPGGGTCGVVCPERQRREEAARHHRPTPPTYVCTPGCTPAAPCMTNEDRKRIFKALLPGARLSKHICAAQLYLDRERDIAKATTALGVSDPQAPVRVTTRVDGVRWAGRGGR